MNETKLRHIATPTYEFIKDSKGVIHVGANNGWERDTYKDAGLPVIFIEPIPDVFQELQENIAGYPNQWAYNYLITDVDGAEYDFHVSNRNGESSSIFEFQEHTELWPDVEYTHSIKMRSRTLKTVIERHGIDLSVYDTLILDVQGAELLVLWGLGDLIGRFKFVRCEAAGFELYKGCCLLRDLDEFFTGRGFARTMTWHYKNANKPKVEQLYEALYQKKVEVVAKPKRPPLAPIYIEDGETGSKAIYKIGLVATVPRLGFQAHSGCLERAFAGTGMALLRTFGVFWEQGIQTAISNMVKAGADYVITVDYDSIFSAADVQELLKLIVRYPEADAIAAWQVGRGVKDLALAGVKTGNGWGGLVSVEEMKTNDLTRVDNTVFGLTIIKTSAILKMPKPWFLNTPNANGDWEEGKHDADSYFWHKFGEVGNTVYMANNVRIGHLQEFVLWLDHDFNFLKQELTDWHTNGRPF